MRYSTQSVQLNEQFVVSTEVDLEIGVGGRWRVVGELDLVDLGVARVGAEVGEELGEDGFVPLDDDLDGLVGKVLYTAGEVQLFGMLADGGAKADSLDEAGDDCSCFHLRKFCTRVRASSTELTRASLVRSSEMPLVSLQYQQATRRMSRQARLSLR